MDDILGQIVFIGLLLGALWWLWQGIKGTWYITNYLAYKGFWQNTCLVILLGVLFGWNLITGTVVLLVCLGPITVAIAQHLWAGEVQS